MKRFVAIGECMIELSPGGAAGEWRQGIAGDTLNTAWYARAMLPADWSVDYVTRLGTDRFSDMIVTFLAENGLGTAHVQRDPVRQPGLYAISLTRGERSFTYWRDSSAARRLADDPDLLERALRGAALVFVSGITLAILAPEARETLLRCLGKARSDGAQIAFDPNIRPRLWESLESARDWILRCAELATIVLPSFDDEAATFGDADPAATVARYRGRGGADVVVKNAGGDVHWAQGHAAGVVTDLPRRTPRDTTGAGDSFNGACLAALLQGRDAVSAIAQGHALASEVILHQGALIGMADLRKLSRG